MAHYAILNDNNIVVNVITGKDEGADIDWEKHYAMILDIPENRVKRTSYNTVNGSHLLGGTPFRKNYAGVGFLYDPVRDAFYYPKPLESWILNEQTCIWEPPVPIPSIPPPEGKYYNWDEPTLSWILQDIPFYTPPTL